MSRRCRLCLKDESSLTSISDIHEGLPISVIMMIVCPVTVIKNDKFPKLICKECMEVVISAYKLRAVSSKSEQFLRSLADDKQPEFISVSHQEYEESPSFEEPISIVKLENHLSDEEMIDESDSNFSTLPKTDDPFRKLNVKCTGQSFTWKYVGPLCNESGHVTNENYVYCSLCMAEGKIQRYKRHANYTAILNHLSTKHGIVKKPKIIQKLVVTSSEPAICDYCNFESANKSSVLRHIMRKHITRPEKTNADYKCDSSLPTIGNNAKVVCDTAKDKSSKNSIVWNYFGKLTDEDGGALDNTFGWNYCRLCLESNRIEQRYNESCSTSTLFRHLQNKHGLFEKADEAEAIRSKTSKAKDAANDGEQHICPICAKSFSCSKYLNRHIKIHNPDHHSRIHINK